MMENSSGSNSSSDVTPEERHRLTFHPHAVGDMVTLSNDHRVAKRTKGTFKNGLVFSSRPVKFQERVRIRVEKDLFNWHGSLRVGFTNVSPSRRALPLPSMAIPNLTDTPGHWATALPESYCRVGSQLDFWVSHDGFIYIMSNSGDKEKLLLKGVDLKQPLWALIDIYGQAYCICLLDSEKQRPVSRQNLTCVVCMVKEASITLPCGHRCLCPSCSKKVLQKFGTCPLCRYDIRSSM